MVAFRNMIFVVENLFNRAKCEIFQINTKLQELHKHYENSLTTSLRHSLKSFKLHSEIVRTTAPFCSDKGEANIPLPPKRPPTAYMVFCRENRPDILKENPDLRGPELIKILAAKWGTLTPSLKKPYEETARESTIVYGKLHKEFYENLTDDQRDALHKLKVEKRETRKMQKLKRMKAKQIDDIKSGPSFIRQAAEEWKSLSEEGKEVFYKKAKEDKQRYERDVIEWREKLIEEGNTELLKAYEEGKYRHRMRASIADSDISGSVKIPVNKKLFSSRKQTEN